MFLALLYLSILSGTGAIVTTDVSLAADKTFDYIIVGGGTAGLTVAGRLTEDANISVLVIEAGPDNRTSPLESVVDFPIAFNTALDWQYLTVDSKTIHGSVSFNEPGLLR